jgi:DNA-binding NarL/FixJ family response regulator
MRSQSANSNEATMVNTNSTAGRKTLTTRIAVLLVTQDAALQKRWQEVSSDRWLIALGSNFQDVQRWRDQGRQLVVLDAELPKRSPWEDAAWKSHFAGIKVLVLSHKPSDDVGRAVLAAGAAGYAHASTPWVEMDRILSTVADGNIWLGRSLLQRLLGDIDSRLPEASKAWTKGLTLREQEVALLAATGESNQAIAYQLDITERTVRAHLSAVFEKLCVSDRLMLALKVHGIQAATSKVADTDLSKH